MIQNLLRPRQSLFDALNIAPAPGLSITLEQTQEPVYPARLVVDVEGVTIATLENGESYETNLTEFSLGILDMTDYQAYVKVLSPGGAVLFDGPMTGSDTITIDEPAAQVVVYKFEYDVTTVATDFQLKVVPKGGIFATLRGLFEVDYIYDVMDQDYIMDNSGTKAVSNAVLMHLTKYGEDVAGAPEIRTLSQQSLIMLAYQIAARFGDAWDHIHDTLVAEYKPLENYNMKEKVTPDTYDQEDIPAGWQKQTKREVNQNISVADAGSHSQRDVWGFNSTSGVPADKVTNDQTVTTSGTADQNFETVTETEVTGRKKLHKGKVETERSGNIGVMTSQQMAQAEIDLRIKNHMEDIIFRDVDQILTTEGYAPILSPTIKII